MQNINFNVFKGRKKFMKKGLSKFISTVLAACMITTGVAVVPFATTSATVYAASGISVTESKGWLESAYIEWSVSDSSYTGYNAYVKKSSDSSWTQLDDPLIRRYSDCWRADAVGLAAGTYDMKVVPMKNGSEVTADSNTATGLTVQAHDRAGAAFSPKSTYKGAGAYNVDGTLKAGAKVIYVTPENAKTVKASIMQDKAEQEFTGLQAIVNALQKGKETAPVDIRIIGMINADDMDSFASKAEGLQIKGKNAYSNLNLTIEGIGEDAGIHGFGMLIRNAGNLELRNFAVMACLDDSISLDTGNCNVWVHNLDLFYGKTGGDADQAKGDGTVDIKGKSTYVTVSYNHFFDNGKSSLCGMKSEVTSSLITYHHNWFDHSDSRHPRIRTMSVHIYNNYFDGNAKYGVGVTMGASAFVEANYFRNVSKPMMSSGQGSDALGQGTFSGENGGIIKAYNNKMVNENRVFSYYTQNSPASTGYDAYEVTSRTAQVPSSETTEKGGTTYNNFDTDANFGINVSDAQVDDPADVPAKVTTYAGRVNGGDFKWTFDNSTEDGNYSVITALKTAVVNYKTTIQSIGGNGTGATDPTTSATTETTTNDTVVTETTTEATTEFAPVINPFKDIVGKWYENTIAELYNKGIVSGVSKDEFAPENNVKRGDFVMLIMNSLGDKFDEITSDEDTTVDEFADVSADSYYHDSIIKARKLGIAYGAENNNFNADDSITREEMCAFTARALRKIDELDVCSCLFVKFYCQFEHYFCKHRIIFVGYGIAC